jgi:hypothetical protein
MLSGCFAVWHTTWYLLVYWQENWAGGQGGVEVSSFEIFFSKARGICIIMA